MLKELIYQLARLVVALGLGVGIGLYMGQRPTAPIGEAVVATTVPELRTVGTETIPCAPVQVFKTPAKKKLALPATVQGNPNQVVTSSVGLKPDLNPHRITSVLDIETGKTTTYDQRLARPWLALNTRSYVGIGYGESDAGRVVRLEAEQALLDIKSVSIVGRANIDQPMNGGGHRWMAGVFAKVGW